MCRPSDYPPFEDKGWYCTSCWERGPRPDFRYLDGTYGSQKCQSIRCHGEQRVFHEEENHHGVAVTDR
jgi:hypothetical protein